MIFFPKRTLNRIFKKIDYTLADFTFFCQNSRFGHGEYGKNEFGFEVDKQLLEAYVQFYSQSNDVNKRNYAGIIKARIDKEIGRVVEISPRRNPWDTENEKIECNGIISFWQLYEATVDAILSSKILGFEVNNFKYCDFSPQDIYLTSHPEKKYYPPTIVAKIDPEPIIELSELKKLIEFFKEEFDSSLELIDIVKAKDRIVGNYLKIIIKGGKNLESLIKKEREEEREEVLGKLLRECGFRLLIYSVDLIDSQMYIDIIGYTFECVGDWKRIIIS